jgi:Double zinc ribbon
VCYGWICSCFSFAGLSAAEATLGNCPRFWHENPPDAKFCLQCGARLSAACPSCGSSVPASAKFCPERGKPISGAADHRFDSPQSYTPKHLAERMFSSKSALEGPRKPAVNRVQPGTGPVFPDETRALVGYTQT